MTYWDANVFWLKEVILPDNWTEYNTELDATDITICRPDLTIWAKVITKDELNEERQEKTLPKYTGI